MVGPGTLVNTAAITAGGLAGLLGGSLMSENMRDGLIKVNGAAVIMIGISGVISGMADISSGSLVMNGTLMMVACLSLGTAVGELINIEDRLTVFGEWLKEKSGSGSDAGFVNAFVTASLTVCIGAMAVVGAVQDGISGDWATIAVKSSRDFLIIMVMTAGMGKGCIFSAVPVFLFQGTVTLLGSLIGPLMTEAAVVNLSLTGSVLVFCVGVNLIFPKTFRICNMLPAVIAAVIWALIL